MTVRLELGDCVEVMRRLRRENLRVDCAVTDAPYHLTSIVKRLGRCWRQAPKWMRDRESKIRRAGKRRGWDDRLCRLHHMAWEACRRWIERVRNGHAAETEASGSPPPAGMMAELQRLGL